jgi:hypothetical protein
MIFCSDKNNKQLAPIHYTLGMVPSIFSTSIYIILVEILQIVI